MNYKPGYLVDNTWWCKQCGSLNAAYRETCGGCNKSKPKINE
jgi:hypothetical protein